jgi:glutaryl-CoA dehydrogenase
MSTHSTDPIEFYALEALLDDRDRGLLHTVRDFGDKQVTPVINQHWTPPRTPRAN